MPDSTDDDRTHHLDAALDHLLAARILAGDLDADGAPMMPGAALDAALRADEDYIAARKYVRKALDVLQEAVDADAWQKALELEAAMNAMAVASTEVAWRLGWDSGSRATAGRAPARPA